MCLEEGDCSCSKNIGGLLKFKLNPKDSDPNLPIHFFKRNKKNPKGSRVTSRSATPQKKKPAAVQDLRYAQDLTSISPINTGRGNEAETA